MDVAIFVATAAFAVAVWTPSQEEKQILPSSSVIPWHLSFPRNILPDKNTGNEDDLLVVNQRNEPIVASTTGKDTTVVSDSEAQQRWCRATYILVMHEPPHLFYEPKDLSSTTVLLLKPCHGGGALQLPGGPLWKQENYHDSAIRHIREDTAIDVCQPENCLHHLFTFPFEGKAVVLQNVPETFAGVWGDFYECIYRGKVDDLQSALGTANNYKGKREKYVLVSLTLTEVHEALTKVEGEQVHNNAMDGTLEFSSDSLHALKLYFQRQGDLRVQRRLLKGYSSVDLEHYGLRPPQEGVVPILHDFQDEQRQAAVDFTLQTDDGQAPRLLPEADLVIMGVSRAGKTPLSILIAQTMGLKVANVPLVFELDPPKQLLVENQRKHQPKDKKKKDTVDPRRVFCLTMQPEYLQRLRMTRLRRELTPQVLKQHGRSLYASLDYVTRDVQKAKDLCLTYGFTEIDVTGRAMEETASLIVSKLRERFPTKSNQLANATKSIVVQD